MDKTYQPHAIETSWYETWESNDYFAPSGEGQPYTIMIPPPNVTGSLHMGHGFNNAIMDALIRYRRMQGRNTLWQPGTDHAGIATQMVVERQLGAQGVSRHDLGREKFLEKIWEWKEQSGGNITRQIRRLGSSVDWSRERFTMDDGLSEAVKEAFVRLHEDGLIYRGKRLVNWDTKLHTAISDLEVENHDEKGHLWHLRYPLVNGAKTSEGLDYLVVATTRPETLLGDAAVAVHPEDERYAKLIGQFAELPIVDRHIPIIADEYVDREFGTGCVKITPAHDFNDYEVGKRHDLPLINIFDKNAAVLAQAQVFHLDGSVNPNLDPSLPQSYAGMDRFAARKAIVAEFEAMGLLEKVDDHALKVPKGDRSGTVIEPWLTDQWYVSTKPLAEDAIAAVEDGTVSSSCPSSTRTCTSPGCATSRTGASAASSGGATASRPGTTRPATSTSTATRSRCAPSTSSATRSSCARTKTFSTPGSAPACGPSPPSAGRSRPSSSRPSTPPTCWSPASTSSSSGSRG